MNIFAHVNFILKKPGENENIDHLDHLYGAILYGSYYVFHGLARGVSVVNFALFDATSKWSALMRHDHDDDTPMLGDSVGTPLALTNHE